VSAILKKASPWARFFFAFVGHFGYKSIMAQDPFLQAAIAEARKGRDSGGIPIGSVVVKNGEIVGRGHNQRVQQNDPMAHAEIDALKNAGRIGSYKDVVLYSTLQPCFLCSGAIVQFKIKTVVVGEAKTFPGAPEFLEQHGVQITNVSDPECIALMETFIKEKPELWNEDIGE
jgi:creatinine deaminase